MGRYSALFGAAVRAEASRWTTRTESCEAEWSRLRAQNTWDEVHGASSSPLEIVDADVAATSMQDHGDVNVGGNGAMPCDLDPWECAYPENYHILIEEVQREEVTTGRSLIRGLIEITRQMRSRRRRQRKINRIKAQFKAENEARAMEPEYVVHKPSVGTWLRRRVRALGHDAVSVEERERVARGQMVWTIVVQWGLFKYLKEAEELRDISFNFALEFHIHMLRVRRMSNWCPERYVYNGAGVVEAIEDVGAYERFAEMWRIWRGLAESQRRTPAVQGVDSGGSSNT